MVTLLRRWLDRRRSLYDEWERIRRVDCEASLVVEELRRRRDGCPPRRLDVPELVAAIRETAA